MLESLARNATRDVHFLLVKRSPIRRKSDNVISSKTCRLVAGRLQKLSGPALQPVHASRCIVDHPVITFVIKDTVHETSVDPRIRLGEVLRDVFGLHRPRPPNYLKGEVEYP